jgi:hypothetical protein
MPKETRKFKFDKPTEHTRVYKEVLPPGKPPIIGKIYVQSWFVGDAEEITVSIETP